MPKTRRYRTQDVYAFRSERTESTKRAKAHYVMRRTQKRSRFDMCNAMILIIRTSIYFVTLSPSCVPTSSSVLPSYVHRNKKTFPYTKSLFLLYLLQITDYYSIIIINVLLLFIATASTTAKCFFRLPLAWTNCTYVSVRFLTRKWLASFLYLINHMTVIGANAKKYKNL